MLPVNTLPRSLKGCLGAAGRPSATRSSRALVSGVTLKGRRATGVRYTLHGRAHKAIARREVVLAAGAINSPKLLELSGIDDPQILSAHGIAVEHESRGVGANLQDHLQIRTVFRVSGARSDASIATPDLEYHIRPLSTDKVGDPCITTPRPSSLADSNRMASCVVTRR